MESKIKEFTQAVISMRTAQKNYFKLVKDRAPHSHIQQALIKAKDLEAKVDRLLEVFEQFTLL